MQLIELNIPVARLCRNAPERSRVLENLGLLEKSGETRSLAEACQEHGLEPQTVARMLTAFEKTLRQFPAVAVELMTLTELCDRLESRHRDFLRHEVTRLEQLIGATIKRNSADNPRLLKLQEAFIAFREKLAAHLCEEARVLFSLIRQLEAGAVGEARSGRSLKTPTARMESQHLEADEALAELRALVGDDSASVSPHARTLCDAVVSVERGLHEQMFEENQILFPRALAIGRA